MKKYLGLLMIGCLILLVGCGSDNKNNNGPSNNTQPTILSISPNTAALGQTGGFAVIIGTNFTGVTSVNLGDAVNVFGFDVKSATEINVHFSVNPKASPGPRTVTVVASTGTVSLASAFNITSNHAPVATFKITPPAGSLATKFTFDASGSSDTKNAQKVVQYSWDFGNGQTAGGKIVEKKFSQTGDFAVSLKVTDDKGAYSVTEKHLQVSKNSPPLPNFTVTPEAGGIGTVFHFDGTSSSDPDGKVTDYLWEFGDGTKKHGDEVDHQYEKQGTYKVTLTVTDNSNQATPSDPRNVVVDKTSEVACQGNGSNHTTIIKGKVIAVEPGNWVIVDFGGGHDCHNTWHKCDDYRRWDPEGFYGIIDKMTDRGNGVLAVHNSCPLHWPPHVGEIDFVYYKTCTQNHCP